MTGENADLDDTLKKINFDGVYINSVNMTMDPISLSVGKLTPFGPVKDTLKNINLPVFGGVADPSGVWYLLAHDGVVRFDPKTQEPKALPVPNGLPEMQFCTGITYDTKRNRVLAVSETFVKNSNLIESATLYAFDIKTQTWSILANLGKISLNGLGYCADDDSLYSIATSESEQGMPRDAVLFHMSAEGKTKGIVSMSEDLISRLTMLPPKAQLAIKDRFLVAAFDCRQTWVFDRFTGRVLRQIK